MRPFQSTVHSCLPVWLGYAKGSQGHLLRATRLASSVPEPTPALDVDHTTRAGRRRTRQPHSGRADSCARMFPRRRTSAPGILADEPLRPREAAVREVARLHLSVAPEKGRAPPRAVLSGSFGCRRLEPLRPGWLPEACDRGRLGFRRCFGPRCPPPPVDTRLKCCTYAKRRHVAGSVAEDEEVRKNRCTAGKEIYFSILRAPLIGVKAP